MLLFPLVIVLGCAAWVYLDAKAIGAKSGLGKGLLNETPGSLALLVALLWIIVFPLYLFKREEIKKLTGNTGLRTGQSAAILILTVVVAFIAFIVTDDHASAPIKSDAPPVQASGKDLIKTLAQKQVEPEPVYIKTATPLVGTEKEKNGLYYKEFLKNPNKYIGKRLSVYGKIFNIEEDKGKTFLQVYVTRRGGDVINIMYIGSMHIYKNDYITIYGEGAGIHEGENAMGAKLSHPLVLARYIKKVKSGD